MAIVFTRIDDRLIHGQVATSWCGFVSPSRIMVIDDDAANNDMQKMVLKMATPAGISLSVLSADKAITNFKSGKYDNQKVMLVVRNAHPLVALLNAGIMFPDVIIGTMPYEEGKERVDRFVCLSKEDINDFKQIFNAGISAYMQAIPTNPQVDLKKALEERGL